jgi:hypothetical protein
MAAAHPSQEEIDAFCRQVADREDSEMKRMLFGKHFKKHGLDLTLPEDQLEVVRRYFYQDALSGDVIAGHDHLFWIRKMVAERYHRERNVEVEPFYSRTGEDDYTEMRRGGLMHSGKKKFC